MFDSIIAKEGQRTIFITFITMLIFVILELGFLSLISFLLVILFIFIYKNRDIKLTYNDLDIISPISGVITAIDVKNQEKSIYIDVDLCNNHILRALENGTCKVRIKKGLNLPLLSFKSKKLNENAIIEFANSKMKLISSMCNTNIQISKQDDLSKGEKIGVFLQGEVIVTLKNDVTFLSKIGDKVQSGITILAKNATK
jgi:energy-coupling factor transporter transmembrane protein EcfT